MASLPGLNGSLDQYAGDALESFDSQGPHSLQLSAGSEWRVQVGKDSQLSLTVQEGIAEIFGIELAVAVAYRFQGTSIAVHAVEDVLLEWNGTVVQQQIVDEKETNASHVYNLHFALEKQRAAGSQGPRVLLVGNRASGKTSLAKTLSSYAIKTRDQGPVVVNLDPQQCIYTPPGCLSATPISDLIDVQNNGWGHSTTSGATALHAKQPLVKNFGLERISRNREWYRVQLQQLATSLDARLANDAALRRAGIIVDTPALREMGEGEDDEYDFSLIHEIVNLFHINAVVVCASDDTLAVKLHRELPVETLTIVRLPTSSGVVLHDDVQIRALQSGAIRDYFYGDSSTVLSPYAVSVDSDAVTVWEPENAISGSSEAPQARLKSVEVNASNLQHALVAISYAPRSASPEEVARSGVLGFALILEVHDARKRLRILLPVPGRLPEGALILTESRYLE
ncbi:LAFA_0B05358g1_1 [Lachancea sp. 'fantastica']|nr:LAFA_0B05358g1_1 [Lachancea sp. 'fantastica']